MTELEFKKRWSYSIFDRLRTICVDFTFKYCISHADLEHSNIFLEKVLCNRCNGNITFACSGKHAVVENYS